jgi:hypothetical protein
LLVVHGEVAGHRASARSRAGDPRRGDRLAREEHQHDSAHHAAKRVV